ncbi:GntR family transcriptional regulator [Alteromonas sediminis]|uniref:GntR family transcriptional regulator n=1 Tax=Alteromonas sediminis TaxID=2259342 RepID=A0A3N5XZH0_9ALTE|nr:GntR family transcriptional regulator [Alteromonas sediminis]RPJ66472.1 GntR family transcriptional regulator [Alteromonas sediminis]
MITIDLDSPEPLFNQLINQIKLAIQKGLLKPSDPLPSIRKLSSELDLNAKTVTKAFRLLERDKVIETKGYRGTFVHPDALQNLSSDIHEWLDDQLQETINKLRDAGATDSEIRIAFKKALSTQTN